MVKPVKNNTPVEITIKMNNVDHATKLVTALENFFLASDMGGDCYLAFDADEDPRSTTQWYIGHDVRRAKVNINFKE
jgi:hypothetical protein